MAIVPFVRQFANSDRSWFDAQPWPNLQRWLSEIFGVGPFCRIMTKYPKWQAGDPPGDCFPTQLNYLRRSVSP